MSGGNPISAVSDAIGNVVEGVGNIGQGIIDTVKDHPLESAALIAAGFNFLPEMGAWMNPATGQTLAGTVEGVAAGTAPTTADALASGGFTGELPAGAAYTAPQVTTLGNVAGPTEGMLNGTSVADMGGAQGLQASGGVGLNAPTTLSNFGTAEGLAGGTGSLIPAEYLAATNAGAAGSSLASMLPYMAGGQIATGLLGAYAANQGANTQAAAAQNAANLQQQNFNLINQQQAPQRGLGYSGVNQLGALGSGTYQMYDASGKPTGTGEGTGYLTHQFNAADLAAGLAPNYDFMLQQGQMANQRAGNVGGGALSGNTLQGLNKFTQDYAGNAYQNAFTNYQTQRNNIYNNLAGIAGIGQAGQNATNTAATNAANAASQLGVGSAAAQAAGTTGVANALGNTANNVINNYTLASLLNQGGRVA